LRAFCQAGRFGCLAVVAQQLRRTQARFEEEGEVLGTAVRVATAWSPWPAL